MRTIGIDVGGTNTDAVLVEGNKVVKACKTFTTEDVISGVKKSLETLMQDMPKENLNISAVMIGTTHFVNAVIQRKHIAKTAVIRASLPTSASLIPFCDWPKDLAEITNGGIYLVEGGHDYDGQPIRDLDEAMVLDAVKKIKASGVTAVAISAPFSTIINDCEKRVRDIVLQEIPNAKVTLSSDVGKIGLLERENVAILNSSLLDLAEKTVDAFINALKELNLDVPMYITQNDGTIATAENAKQRPVLSFASGPTNSMRGAVFLSGIEEAVVCDVGGTTSDLGYLINKFPREANNVVEVGGVRTLFRMPDLFSIALGGGTIIHDDATVGPLSVAYQLFDKGMAFGGDTLTATDIMIATGQLDLGDKDLLKDVKPELIQQVKDNIAHMVTEAVDQIKSDARDVPLLAVGGGAPLVPDTIEGISEVIKVENYDVANAVGAAIAQISGYTDKIFSDMKREDAIAQATVMAKENAVANGADPDSLEVVEVEDIPMSYMPGSNNLQVKVKVVGDVKIL